MGWFVRRDKAGKSHWFRTLVLWLVLLFAVLPVIYILICRFVPVPGTPQMALYFVTGRDVHHEWVSWNQLPTSLKRSVIASEDQKFCHHHGFDVESIENVVAGHDGHARKRLRGASTLSQQTARTIFLLPVRSWIRKGLEAWDTVLIEALWPKQRILEAYLNLVDWGNGNFGAEAASRAYFHKSARHLTPLEAARLATILPDPDVWSANHPGSYVRKRSRVVEGRAHIVRRDELDICVRHTGN